MNYAAHGNRQVLNWIPNLARNSFTEIKKSPGKTLQKVSQMKPGVVSQMKNKLNCWCRHCDCVCDALHSVISAIHTYLCMQKWRRKFNCACLYRKKHVKCHKTRCWRAEPLALAITLSPHTHTHTNRSNKFIFGLDSKTSIFASHLVFAFNFSCFILSQSLDAQLHGQLFAGLNVFSLRSAIKWQFYVATKI